MDTKTSKHKIVRLTYLLPNFAQNFTQKQNNVKGPHGSL